MHIVTFLVRAACNSVQEPATFSNHLSKTFNQEISLLVVKHMFQSSKYYLDWSSPTRHEVDPDVQLFTAATGTQNSRLMPLPRSKKGTHGSVLYNYETWGRPQEWSVLLYLTVEQAAAGWYSQEKPGQSIELQHRVFNSVSVLWHIDEELLPAEATFVQ